MCLDSWYRVSAMLFPVSGRLFLASEMLFPVSAPPCQALVQLCQELDWLNSDYRLFPALPDSACRGSRFPSDQFLLRHRRCPR